MLSAFRDVGPQVFTLLVVVFGLLTWANREDIRDWWLR